MNEEFNGVKAVEELCQSEQLHPTIGNTTGVKHLCRLVHLMGHQDQMHMGQFQGACYGDLINFLEDNPGACEKIVEFIQENAELWDVFTGEQEENDE